MHLDMVMLGRKKHFEATHWNTTVSPLLEQERSSHSGVRDVPFLLTQKAFSKLTGNYAHFYTDYFGRLTLVHIYQMHCAVRLLK